tara:strand:- start:3307 stop:4530 length:1224 start_codon:yes stop_codon:yes gene_type:complete
MLTPFQQQTARLPFAPTHVGNPALHIPRPPPVPKDQGHSPPNLPRALNFYADYSGCGHWRMIWPELLLNCYAKVNLQGGTVMIGEKNFYQGVKTVRIQRQATETQAKYIKWLKDVGKEAGFKIIYEIDDIIFKEDIPHYNKFRFAFEDPKIRQTSLEIMQTCDEITVTNKFMQDYYIEKTGNKNVTIIPNFIPKFWMDRYFNFENVRSNYQKFKKKPRVVYCGSGAHFDIENRIKQKDDFHHINDVIRKTVDKFQWVFVGGFPLTLRDLIKEKKIEYHQWSNLVDYPNYINNMNATVFYAPLEDSNFNKAKSDLKFIEACAMGIPVVCQDLCTYNTAFHKFKTGDDLINQIELLTRDSKKYNKEVKRARQYMKSRWMEDNIGFYAELYSFPYADPRRKNLNRLNKIS